MSVTDTEVTFTGEVHPAAEAWPMLPTEELDELAVSIANDGLMEPLTLDADGRLLDGRNRLAACGKACVDPVFVVHIGDPIAFIIARNSTRRHMAIGARAMATAKVLADAGRRKNGRWQRGAITGSGNSGWQQRMTEAGLVVDFTPGDTEKVISGELALDAAYRKAQQMKAASESYDAKREQLAKDAPDLAENVHDEQSLAENLAALKARQEQEAAAFRVHVKQVQEAASAWPVLEALASRSFPRQADVLLALGDDDRSVITDAINLIRKAAK